MVKMETDTLSYYEQTQDKHVLDDSMEINIPRNELNDSHESKEIHIENTQLCLKENVSSDNTENHKVNSESSENKENENDGDRYITNNDDPLQENDSNSDKDSEIDDRRDNIERESIDSEEKNSTNDALNGDVLSHSDEEIELSNNQEEEDPLSEEITSGKNEASSSKHIEIKGDAINSNYNKEDSSTPETVNYENCKAGVNNVAHSEEQNKSEDKRGNEESKVEKGKNKEKHKESVLEEEAKDNYIDNEENRIKVGKIKIESKKGTMQDEDDCRDNEENKIKDDNEVKSKNGAVQNQNQRDTSEQCSLLKETLIRGRPENDEQPKEGEGENGMEDIDIDEDFDPSLLCPDIAMEVEEAPVITSNEIPPSDGNKSPLLYEPIFSTYVDEMTGAEVSFNLSVEEHKLRQEMYGDANPVQYSKVHCTACNVHLGSALDGQTNRFVHPLLKVLICKNCYHFYTSGEFEKDEDGSELYCRWCGQGGQVICCSSCEMVFCKKCIRINYGRKKLMEIRDIDDWLCFRCDPSQLTLLRVHCAEFMEYVRREISRAATLENATSFMTTDYTHCCLFQKKKYVEPHPNEPKKKKRKSVHDPDYDPMKDRSVSPQPSTSAASPSPGDAAAQKLVSILPKIVSTSQSPVVVGQFGQTNSVFRVGNTTFRPKSSPFSQPRPRVQVVNPGTSIRQQSSGPGYIKIMPGGIRVHPPIRTQNSQTFGPRQPSFQHRPAKTAGSTQMKHEWFEKTVRAAARVNSNLSYTLTQLNRAQASATSVEALAVVHNKLQEILSTSINSLIQIRKNLRAEFIAGIKNIRFPPKSTQPQPSTSSQDDDVIFVSPTTSSVPPPLLQASSSNVISPLTSINLPPSVSLTKRVTPTSILSSTSKAHLSASIGDDKPKVFLRVKSLTALQSVPSECITIPDDPLPPPPPLAPLNQLHEITIIDNSPEKNSRLRDEKSDIDTEVIEVISTTADSPEKASEGKPAEDIDLTVNGTNSDKTENADAILSADTAETSPSADTAEESPSADTAEESPSADTAEVSLSADKTEVTPSADTSEATRSAEIAEAAPSADTAERIPSAETAEATPSAEAAEATPANTAEATPSANATEATTSANAIEWEETDIEEESSKEKENSNSAVAFDEGNTTSVELKRLFNVKIHITRSDEIDERVKQLFGLVNGDSSE